MPPITFRPLRRSHPLGDAVPLRSPRHRRPSSYPPSFTRHRSLACARPVACPRRRRPSSLHSVRIAAVHCPAPRPAVATTALPRLLAFVPPASPLVVAHLSDCCCPLAPAPRSASGPAINICDVLVEEGGPRVEAKRRGGDPLPRASCRAKLRERAGSRVPRSVVSPRKRRPNDPPRAAPTADRATSDEGRRTRRRLASRRRLPRPPARRGRARSRVAGRARADRGL
jgi:hypothetical protein